MNLSAPEIGHVITELVPTWTGAQIQKVHMHGPRLALLTLRVPGQTGVLRISVERSSSYLCVSPERGAADPQASAFCMLMRKWLKGARISSLEQVGGDRLVALRTSRGTLWAELFGRLGQLVLCDDADRLLGVSPQGSLRDGLRRGQPYGPPEPVGEAQASERFGVEGANQAILELYGDSESLIEVDSSRIDLGRRLKSHLKRQRRLVSNIEADRARAGSYDELSKRGELLKINLGGIRRGMTSITVADVLALEGDAPDIEIPLEPSMSPTGNMERAFAKARKARRAPEATALRLRQARRNLDAIEALREELEDAQGTDIEGIRNRLEALGLRAPPGPSAARSKRTAPRVPYKTYLDARKKRILVGRSAGDNDTLTVQVAKPDDLWLHARGTKGSHVVVPLTKGEQVDSERLLDAATLAAHFSEARGNTTVEVTYTPRKYVQKLKGLPRGKVVLLREKVMLLKVESDRLKRLLASRRDG